MRALISIGLMISASALASTGCNSEELTKSCHASICNERPGIPSTIDGLREDFERAQISGLSLDNAALDTMRSSAQRLQSGLASLPNDDQSILREILRDKDASINITEMLGRYRTVGSSGENIISDMLSPEEKDTIQNTLRLQSQDIDVSFFARNLFPDADLPQNLPMVLDEYDTRGLAQMREYLTRVSPEKLTLLNDILTKRQRGEVISSELKESIGLSKVTEQMSAELFTKNISTYGNLYRMHQRDVLADSTARLNRLADNCRLVDYMNRKMRATNNRERFAPMVKNVLASVYKNLLPKFSAESAATIKSHLTPDKFELAVTKPEFSYFQIPAPRLLRASSIAGSSIDLDTFSKQGCKLEQISTSVAQDEVVAEEDGTIKILISPLTLAQGEESVIAHEVGHYITQTLGAHPLSSVSVVKLLGVRTCLNGMHPGDTRASILPDPVQGDLYHTDEDFGDWVAASTGFGGDYISCDIEALTTIGKRSALPTYLSNKNDNHSTDLFRALHMRMVGNKHIPTVCRDMMESMPEETPKKCEL